MKRLLAVSLASLSCLTTAAVAQTSADISRLIGRSKLVDTGRQVNTSVSGDKALISTYSDAQATNQDCKITALLMMKEVHQHYRNIHRISVLFYDPKNNQHYREVAVREGDALLVDTGKPLKEVLTQLDVVEHRAAAAAPPVVSSAAIARGAAANSAQKFHKALSSTIAPSGYMNWKSKEGDVSLLVPSDWAFEGTEGGTAACKFVKTTATGSGVITLYKHPSILISLDDLALLHEKGEQQKSKEFKLVTHREQHINGVPGVVYEFQGVMLNGAPLQEKCLLIKVGTAGYMLVCYFFNQSSADANNIFSTVSASMKIRS